MDAVARAPVGNRGYALGTSKWRVALRNPRTLDVGMLLLV